MVSFTINIENETLYKIDQEIKKTGNNRSQAVNKLIKLGFAYQMLLEEQEKEKYRSNKNGSHNETITKRQTAQKKTL